jgi:hypothetical protein
MGIGLGESSQNSRTSSETSHSSRYFLGMNEATKMRISWAYSGISRGLIVIYIYIYVYIYTYSISNMIWRSLQIGNLLPNCGHFNRENYDQQVDLGYTLFWDQKKWTGGIVLVFLMLNELPSSFLILCFWLLDFLVGHRSLALFGGCRLAC